MKRTQAILALKSAQLKKGHRRETRRSYRGWLLRYIAGASAGHFSDLQGFLDHLTTVEELNPKTIRQALNALVFFHRHVLGEDPGKLEVPRINKHRNQPTWLHHHEAADLIARMRGPAQLQAAILYGTGSRINATLTLRLKDIDLHAGLVTFRFDKGGKSRVLQLPRMILPALGDHIERIRRQWETDHDRGIIAPDQDASLMRKLGRATFSTLPWYWLFPSQVIRGKERWHATDRGLCKAISTAARAAGLTKRVTAHTLRHSNATALLNRGENIRAIQEHLGHSHLETTEIYTHTTARDGLASPLDDLSAIVPFPHHRPAANQ